MLPCQSIYRIFALIFSINREFSLIYGLREVLLVMELQQFSPFDHGVICGLADMAEADDERAQDYGPTNHKRRPSLRRY